MKRPSRGRGIAARATGAVLAAGLAVAAGMTGAGAQAAPAPRTSPHWGIDTCDAPPLDVLRAWAGTSPYDTIAAYIGGSMRACPNVALTNPAWVAGALGMGWNIIPVIVDVQAPCTDFRDRIDPAIPGVHAFLVAINTLLAARSAGIQPGDPIYLDIEPWLSDDPACADVVREFVRTWATALRQNGYVPGVYSTASTGIATVLSTPGLVDAVWVASWNDTPGAMGDAGSPAWAGRRIHQYRGEHEETWAGQTLAIDSNWIDGPVVRPRVQALEGG